MINVNHRVVFLCNLIIWLMLNRLLLLNRLQIQNGLLSSAIYVYVIMCVSFQLQLSWKCIPKIVILGII